MGWALGSARNDDEGITEISVEVDTSSLVGDARSATRDVPPATVADSASPADAEPRTLEPRMTVRGLGPKAEGRLREAAAVAAQRARPAFGSIITPSEPFRITSPALGATAGSAPVASRPRLYSEVEDDAVTDRMRSAASGAASAPIPRLAAAADARSEDDELEDEETETKPLQDAAALVGVGVGIVGSAPTPRADGAAPDEPSLESGKGAPGGTVRIIVPNSAAPRLVGPPPFVASPPPVPAPPPSFRLPEEVALAPPSAARRPSTRRRGSGGVLAMLLVVSLVAACAALYHSRYRPVEMTLEHLFHPGPASSASAGAAHGRGPAAER
jgi:hypothetical protein